MIVSSRTRMHCCHCMHVLRSMTIRKMDHKIVVSKGPRNKEYDLPKNSWGTRFLPQMSIIPLMNLVITHGGNNTITETFAQGKPMIVMPLFGDQYDNAQRLHEMGWAIRLDPYDFSPQQLIEAVEKLLNDDELKGRLRKASERILSNNRHKSAVTINVWIGAKRLNGHKFEWEDGSEVGQFTNWAEGYPTDKAQQSCVVIKSEHMRPTGNTAGEWRNVPCDAPNYVLCEKLPRWSTKKLQQTLLDNRKELKDSNAFLVMELDVTNEQLESTVNELNITKNQLANTNSELANTKNQLSNINHQLTTTKNQLASTIIELTSTKNQLTNQLSQSTAMLESKITETKNILVPIGFQYTQLPNEKAPSEIWPWMRWADMSSVYAGAFFRVDGGGSAPFGQVQSENTQRLTGIQSDETNCNLLYNVRTVIGGWSQGGYSGGWDGGNVCLKFEMSGGEIRPRNMAIRIWRRTG